VGQLVHLRLFNYAVLFCLDRRRHLPQGWPTSATDTHIGVSFLINSLSLSLSLSIFLDDDDKIHHHLTPPCAPFLEPAPGRLDIAYFFGSGDSIDRHVGNGFLDMFTV
jgi:hypothetical protein